MFLILSGSLKNIPGIRPRHLGINSDKYYKIRLLSYPYFTAEPTFDLKTCRSVAGQMWEDADTQAGFA
jgi:hypothetical protein